jgi:8-oxo-dGTP diphosphatase
MTHPPLILVVAAALVDAHNRVLIAQRPQHKSLPGLWEFPGGKVEQGERPEAALARELEEELDIVVDPDDFEPFAFVSHAYAEFHLLMPLYLVRRWKGAPVAREHTAFVWALPCELKSYAMPPADLPLVDELLARVK